MPPFLLPVSVILVLFGIYLFFKPIGAEKDVQNAQKFIGIFLIALAFYLPFFTPGESVEWQPYTPQAYEAALKDEKPIIIDFFAEWCAPCHELEYYTYTNERVIEALERFTRFKADVTDPRDEKVMKVVERFEVAGVPTILFIDASGEVVEEARIMGFIGPEELLMVIESPRLRDS